MKKKFIQLLIDMNIISNKEDISNTLASFYLDSAREFVKNYVNKRDYDDSDYEDEFEMSILNIAIYMYNAKKNGLENVSSKTQGNRSISFRGFEIPESYYMNLPKFVYPSIWGDSNMSVKHHCCETKQGKEHCFFERPC